MIEEKRRNWVFPACLVMAYEAGLVNAEEMMLLGKINALCDPIKGCFATNKYLAAWWGKTRRWVRRTLEKFEKLELIEISREDEKRIIRATFQGDEIARKLRKRLTAGHGNKSSHPWEEKFPSGGKKSSHPLGRKVPICSTERFSKNDRVAGASAGRAAGAAKLYKPSLNLTALSSTERLCKTFAEFTTKKGLHIGNQGSTKQGWTNRTIKRWIRSVEDLLEQVGNIKEIERTMEWYFHHYGDEFVPTAETMTAFCRKYTKFKRAMRRSGNGADDNDDDGDGPCPYKINVTVIDKTGKKKKQG